MPEDVDDSQNMDQALLPDNNGNGTQSHQGATQGEIGSLNDLVGSRGRERLRELAEQMKQSGALRIKDHRNFQGYFPRSFKGEYARDWILKNESLVESAADAIRVGQAMLELAIFHSVSDSNSFDPKDLYAFNKSKLGNLDILKYRIVAIEDQNIAQTKANKEAQADAFSRSVQLDWRISVSERRLAATEQILRRCLVVQQVLLWTFLVLLLISYAPVWFNVAHYLTASAVVVLVMAALESQRVLSELLSIRIDYKSIASGVMGLHIEDDDRVEESLNLDAQTSTSRHSESSLTDAAVKAAASVVSVASSNIMAGQKTLWQSISNASQTSQANQQAEGVHPPGTVDRLLPKPTLAGLNPERHKPHTTLSLPCRNTFTSEPFAEPASSLTRSPPLNRQSAPVFDTSAQFVAERTASFSSHASSGMPGDLLGDSSNLLSSGISCSPLSSAAAPQGPPVVSDMDNWHTNHFLVRQPAGEIRLLKPLSTRGRVSVWVKGIPLGPGCPDVFKKKRRNTWVIVQGRFKKKLPVSEVYTGQMFSRRIDGVPSYIFSAVMLLVQSFSKIVKSASIIENNDAPSVLYPLAMMAQTIHVTLPGQEPSMLPQDEVEDCSLMFAGLPTHKKVLSSTDRKSFFNSEANRQAVSFDPAYVYTFHIRQHVVDVANYKIPLPGIGKLNLLPYLRGQPLRFMAYHRSSEQHIFNLEAWHRGLLESNAVAEEPLDVAQENSQEYMENTSVHGSSTPATSVLRHDMDHRQHNGSPFANWDASPLSCDAALGELQELGGGSTEVPELDRQAVYDSFSLHQELSNPIQADSDHSAKYSNVSIPPVHPELATIKSGGTPKLARILTSVAHKRSCSQNTPRKNSVRGHMRGILGKRSATTPVYGMPDVTGRHSFSNNSQATAIAEDANDDVSPTLSQLSGDSYLNQQSPVSGPDDGNSSARGSVTLKQMQPEPNGSPGCEPNSPRSDRPEGKRTAKSGLKKLFKRSNKL